MLKRRSFAAFLAAAFATVYTVTMMVIWSQGQAALTELFTTNPIVAGFGSVAGGVVSLVLLPHFITSVAGSLLGIIGFVFRNDGLILAAAILYVVSAALFFLSVPFLLPSIVLGFFGYANQRRALRNTAST